jgi:predicted RNase H-related nuclease YkuK (DUF458 family)
MLKLDIEEVREYIMNSSQASKVYIGCDSERFKIRGVWHADYCLAVIIHKDGKHGCKVFGGVVREADYDSKPGRPALRLMNEVYKVSELYDQLKDAVGKRYCEVHLDINPEDRFGSSCVVNQAIGYVRGTCNMTPRVKPEAFAASVAADRMKELLAA